MPKEFNFVQSKSNDMTLFKATEITDTGIYRISWNDDEKYKLYLPEHVKGHLDAGRWVTVE